MEVDPVATTGTPTPNSGTTCCDISVVSKAAPSSSNDYPNSSAKQFLISYVRAEAACSAKALKFALEQLGYSVYLVSKCRCCVFFSRHAHTQIIVRGDVRTGEKHKEIEAAGGAKERRQLAQH